MRDLQDVRELLTERGAAPEERRVMESAAYALDERLAVDVPARPAFQAQLRKQLLAQARQSLPPWYRRPAVWAPSLSVAAAVAVLAFGMQFWRQAPPSAPLTPPDQVAQGQSGDEPITSHQPLVTPGLTSDPGNLNLERLQIPDEYFPTDVPDSESIDQVNLSQGLVVYRSVMLADREQFDRIAGGLGFTEPPVVQAGGFGVTQSGATLAMSFEGQVFYSDPTAIAATNDSLPIDSESAQETARRFLVRAGLPVPSLPAITEAVLDTYNERVFVVTYTPRIDRIPVVNGRTVVKVSRQNRVVEADAYIPAREEQQGRYRAILPTMALTTAQEMGEGTFDQQDLVYVRSHGNGGIYLQPFWRLFGTDSQGNRVARYVAALVGQ